MVWTFPPLWCSILLACTGQLSSWSFWQPFRLTFCVAVVLLSESGWESHTCKEACCCWFTNVNKDNPEGIVRNELQTRSLELIKRLGHWHLWRCWEEARDEVYFEAAESILTTFIIYEDSLIVIVQCPDKILAPVLDLCARTSSKFPLSTTTKLLQYGMH